MGTLEGYEIFAEIKRGPWIAIYKAFDVRRQRTVLVKMLLHPDAPAAVQEQLGVEGGLRQHFSHPNLRAVYDSGAVEGRAFLVLEYVEGPTLAELIAQNLPIELCAWIAQEVAQALAAIHRHGLLHRDVKPQNIFVAQTGEVKLGDFGLAIDCNEAGANLAGTPAYFSPELVLGQNLSARSDLFSLGAVLYEMLTAAPPFADHATPAILHRIANLEPVPPEKLRPEIPRELAALCRHLLCKNPEQRCPSADAVMAALAQFQQNYDLRLSAKSLAQFLHQPEAYARAEFQRAAPLAHALSASAPAPPERPVLQSAKRRLVPMVFAATILCGFILLNLENKATENPPAVPASALPPALPQSLQTEKALGSAATLAENSSAQTGKPSPDQSEVHALEAKMREPLVPPPPGPRLAGVVPAEEVHASSIWVLSEPRAEVYVENDSLGLTPVRWRPAHADQVYELRFVSPALPQVNKLVTATILESDTLALDLWREFAYLEIVVHPWGEIWMDGRPLDTTPLAAPLMLTPGLHELDVRHPQFGTHSQRLVLTKGDTLRKVINLLAP